MLNYDEYVWDKYGIGEWLNVIDPATGKPAVKNLFYKSKTPRIDYRLFCPAPGGWTAAATLSQTIVCLCQPEVSSGVLPIRGISMA
jgi:hypothetical protein